MRDRSPPDREPGRREGSAGRAGADGALDLDRRQFFDWVLHRVFRSADVRFSRASLMRVDHFARYDPAVIQALVPQWRSHVRAFWRGTDLAARRGPIGRERVWRLSAGEARLLQGIDGVRTIGEIAARGLDDGVVATDAARLPELVEHLVNARVLRIRPTSGR